MRVAWVKIRNFRGIAEAELLLDRHTVLIGDNNSGKSSVLEAIDLVLGPDRLSRAAPIDEHDFYASRYLEADGKPIRVSVELLITDLSPEQKRRFKDNLEFWDDTASKLIEGPPIRAIEGVSIKEAIRVGFCGWYEAEDDDFKTETYFCHPLSESGHQPTFRTADKRECGFLFLRTLRTGSRALSLERGSLLDIVLRVRELRPKMWEKVLGQLRDLPVASDTELGVSKVLSGVLAAIREFVPAEWASDPHLRVSDLTREQLRRTLTVFMATGAMNGSAPHSAPFQHQGTGTINMLVLALLSMIADAKKSVIFAMEEPEIAIPPSTQKRIVDAIRNKSAQALFTSHSPYILEEFDPKEVLSLSRSSAGILSAKPIVFPAHIKPKSYSSEYRLRFSEALLARRVLIAESRTEAIAYSTAALKLAELDPQNFSSLESLGVAVFDAQTDSKIADYGTFFRNLGKTVFAVFDKQDNPASTSRIKASADHAFEAPAKDFEVVVLNETCETALRRFGEELVASGAWPSHLAICKPRSAMTLTELKSALREYFNWSKGAGTIGDLLGQCQLIEMPAFVTDTLSAIRRAAQPPPPPAAEGAAEPRSGEE